MLEVGCGPGVDAARLAARGLEVTATDYAPEFVSIVRERYPELRARVMDMTEPDLPSQSFDGVYGFASFIHLPRSLADQTLRRLRELLVPGGLLSLMMIDSTQGIREYTIEDWIDGGPMLFTCHDPEELETDLAAAGYGEISCHRVQSDLYESMPRLLERGIRSYQLFATRI
ncbi:MAG TPA: class I SAM-dependent methyltransferase [Myxococcota bacterium]|nr:class I SAM-dependent methyltransferase [Myxococcota bacterium]